MSEDAFESESVQHARTLALLEENSLLREHVMALSKSRAVKTARNVRKAVTDPLFVTKKAVKLAYRHPQKFMGFISGSREIASPAEKRVVTTDYQQWIDATMLSEDDLEKQRKAAEELVFRPKISIITPVFNPPEALFEELIKSVQAQTYDNWELCAGEFAQTENIQQLLTRYEKSDNRIKPKFFTENGGISKNSDMIFEYTTGEYIALLDHDDVITPNALYEMVKKLNEEKYDLLFSDKDLLDDETNQRFNPLFKPEWSPELMLCANYVTHFDVIKRSVIEKIGGWDSTTDGAQDWDLFLRISEVTNKIAHVPGVFYQWRVIPTSTAGSIDAKPYALAAQEKSVQKHLDHCGYDAKVYRDELMRIFVKWPKKSSPVDAVVIISRHESLLTPLLKKITQLNALPEDVPIHIIASHEARAAQGLCESIATYEPGSLRTTLKTLLESLEGEVLFMGDGVLPDIGWPEKISQLAGWLSVPEIVAAAPRIDTKDHLICGSGRVLDDGVLKDVYYNTSFNSGIYGSYEWIRNYVSLQPTFCVVAIKRLKKEILDENLFDHEVLDAMLISALDKQLRCVYDPSITVVNQAMHSYVSIPSDSMATIVNVSLRNKDPYFNRLLKIIDGQPGFGS